ncbi:Major facilitator superfamily domain,Major facilitator superfamily associated domain [Cinara cedri]|uniref:Major facilitator superfamily domain,Major facilitator superfamily associated domain n=1 Tax=Cinara cedri TaxID=506608 RepID=A0A5E4MYJ4_9HEMI|nr:Major facilitator superfamily domain,Major facilitator superfamily associated domain [Cinara cedri]
MHFKLNINEHMLRMKLHFFLYLGGVSTFIGFSPTIAKQLGYSPEVVGFLYTYLSILSFLVKPIFGFIVDQFPIRRIVFLTVIMLSGLSIFSMQFIEKLPTETAAILNCSNLTTVLTVCSNTKGLRLAPCDDRLSKRLSNVSEPVTCQLSCQENKQFWDESCTSWNITADYCATPNDTIKSKELYYLNISLSINTTYQGQQNDINFEVESINIKKTEVSPSYCNNPVSTRCKINCSKDVIMRLATVTEYNKSIFGLRQFWEYLIVMSVFWISQAITWSLQDPICLDLLGDKANDFGKQRCWGSVSWGLFAVFGGVLVDYLSDSDYSKNYVPVFYLCLIVILCDFILAYKIKVTENVSSKNKISDIFKLLTNLNVIVYVVWILAMGICTSLVWNYLFWYMEDINSKFHGDKHSWIKTLEGAALFIQCLGGEVPFFFFSGWLIKRIGCSYCMCLGLFGFAARFYLFSIITDPVWILPVELFDGITFGLFHAVMVAYARIIAPQNAVTTVVGFAGSIFEGVGLSLGGLLGGYTYERYGGSWTFELFAYGALIMGVIHLIIIKIMKL